MIALFFALLSYLHESWRSLSIEVSIKIFAFVVNDGEGRRVLNFDLLDRFHPEIFVFQGFYYFHTVFGELGNLK